MINHRLISIQFHINTAFNMQNVRATFLFHNLQICYRVKQVVRTATTARTSMICLSCMSVNKRMVTERAAGDDRLSRLVYRDASRCKKLPVAAAAPGTGDP